jgi:hypothetical protein
MIYDGPTPWNEAVVCAACGTTLLPLTYSLPPEDDPREDRRPLLMCSECGQRYRWQGSAGWGPVGGRQRSA